MFNLPAFLRFSSFVLLSKEILEKSHNDNSKCIRWVSLCIYMIPPDKLSLFSSLRGMLFVPMLESKSISKAFSHPTYTYKIVS